MEEHGFSLQAAQSLVYDLTSGEYPTEDQQQKDAFVTERIAAHIVSMDNPIGNGSDFLGSDVSVSDVDDARMRLSGFEGVPPPVTRPLTCEQLGTLPVNGNRAGYMPPPPASSRPTERYNPAAAAARRVGGESVAAAVVFDRDEEGDGHAFDKRSRAEDITSHAKRAKHEDWFGRLSARFEEEITRSEFLEIAKLQLQLQVTSADSRFKEEEETRRVLSVERDNREFRVKEMGTLSCSARPRDDFLSILKKRKALLGLQSIVSQAIVKLFPDGVCPPSSDLMYNLNEVAKNRIDTSEGQQNCFRFRGSRFVSKEGLGRFVYAVDLPTPVLADLLQIARTASQGEKGGGPSEIEDIPLGRAVPNQVLDSAPEPPSVAIDVAPLLDWDKLAVSESVAVRLGIEGNAALTSANANAVALSSYARSLHMYEKEDGVVTIAEDKVPDLISIHVYTEIVRSAVAHDSEIIRLKVHAMLPFRQPLQRDVDRLITDAFQFSRLILQSQSPSDTVLNSVRYEAWMNAVGKDPKRDWIRLCSLVEAEQTMWKEEKFLDLHIYAMVLSDFIGEVSASRLTTVIVPIVRCLIVNSWVEFDKDHMSGHALTDRNSIEFKCSTLAFERVSRAFAMALVINELPAKATAMIVRQIHKVYAVFVKPERPPFVRRVRYVRVNMRS
jgi:hypothetical protein